jgi:HEAT repeat protein
MQCHGRLAYRLALTAAVALSPLSLSNESFAHGGRYGGPSDSVPPNLGGGGDGTPGGPGNPGGPSTPGPGGPATGGAKGPTTGGPAAPPTGGRNGSGAFGKSRNKGSGGYDQWEFWWENNDDPFLALKDRMRRGRITSQSGLARGLSSNADPARRPTPSDVADTIVPALLSVMDSSEADLVDSAVLALARVLPSEKSAVALPALRAALHHDAKSVRESATLALGVLGAPEAVVDLRELLLDTPDGRAATRHPNGVEPQVRAFAAAALGLIGAPQAAADLERVVRDGKLGANDDLKALALLSLGLLSGGHEAIVAFEQDALGDRELPALVRAQAPIALARIADQEAGRSAARGALHFLLARFQDEKSDDVRRSLAIALGRIAGAEDVEVIDGLAEASERASDVSTREFSLMALAELGARDGDAAGHAALHQRLGALFTRTLEQPVHSTDKPYGALGLGVWARNPALDRKDSDAARSAIAAQFERENNPSFKGALAISLGLLGAAEHSDALASCLEDARESPLRGYLAVGLGLMNSRRHSEALITALETKGVDSKAKLQYARALGLLGDAKAVDVLTRQFKESNTLQESSATVQALGLIGDRGAIVPLVAVLRDARETPQRRGFAAVGLGLLAEKTDLPWSTRFTIDSNYRAKTAALIEIFDIL